MPNFAANSSKRIILAYLLTGFLWILFSDQLIALLPSRALIIQISTLKGWLFVVSSAALFYYLIQRVVSHIDMARSELETSEHRLTRALAASHMGVWEWDLRSDSVLWSPECYQIVGLADFDGRFASFATLLHPDDAERVVATVQKALADHAAYTDEFRIIRPDGQTRWLCNHGYTRYDDDGMPLVLLGTVQDVTERKRIEQELQASEMRFRAVVEDQTEVISRYRPDRTYTFVNDAYCRLFGKTREELLGNSWHPDAYPEDLGLIEAQLRGMSPVHPVVTIENRVCLTSGEVRWMQFINRGFFDQNGQLVETQAVGRDITDLKVAEAKLEAYASELHDLYDNAPCGYHSLDANGTYVRINETELRWLGYERDEIIGQMGFANLIAPECVPAFRANFARLKEQGYVEGLEYTIIRKDGTTLDVLLNATVIRDRQGTYVMSRGAMVDITERKQSVAMLRKYSQRMVELEEELRRKLAAELHDEIGRDLTALGLNLAIVHDHLPDEVREKLSDRLEDSRTSLETISCTVRGLMSKLRPPVLDDYGLPAALRWHCDLFSKRAGLAVNLVVGESFPRMPTSTELALFRIAQEAMANASRHAEARSICVELLSEDETLRFSISDDGVGFDASQALSKKLDSHWGLTMMRERAEAVDGLFHLDTAPGRGTTILVKLKKGD